MILSRFFFLREANEKESENMFHRTASRWALDRFGSSPGPPDNFNDMSAMILNRATHEKLDPRNLNVRKVFSNGLLHNCPYTVL